MAYFDNASTTYPKPYCVYDFMDSFYRSSGANAGRGNYKLAQSAGALIGDTRKKIQELLHCQAKQVVFEPTATIALNIIIQGIIEKGAVNIYISPFEHNAVTRTLHHFEEQEKIKITQLTVSKGMVYDLEKIRYQFDTVKPDFVIVSHASNVFGLIAPVEDIFALAKKYEAITLVDMAQTAGLVDLNVGLTTIDFAVFAGHKTLYGPTGISGFVMNPAVKFPAVIFGGTGYESANQDMPEDLPQKYEMGTQDIAGIAGLNAALGWSAQVTIDAIRKKEAENRKKLIDLLSRYSYIKIIGNYDSCNYVGIVSCIIEGISSDSAGPVFDRCGIAVRTGLQCAPLAHQFMGTFPAGTIRFSVNYFTTDKDFAELEQALKWHQDRYRFCLYLLPYQKFLDSFHLPKQQWLPSDIHVAQHLLVFLLLPELQKNYSSLAIYFHKQALLLPVESLYMMRHRLLMQPVLPRMNTMIMRKETMRLYSIELLSLIRI